MLVVDFIGSASRASPPSKGTFSLTLTAASTAYPPQSLQGLFHCTLYPRGQCMIHSPSGTPACKTSLCKNKRNYQGQLCLQNKKFVPTATDISFLKTVRILCSIPVSFFSREPLGTRHRYIRQILEKVKI